MKKSELNMRIFPAREPNVQFVSCHEEHVGCTFKQYHNFCNSIKQRMKNRGGMSDCLRNIDQNRSLYARKKKYKTRIVSLYLVSPTQKIEEL